MVPENVLGTKQFVKARSKEYECFKYVRDKFFTFSEKHEHEYSDLSGVRFAN